MVRLKKSPLPAGLMIKKEQDYRSDPIFKLIRDDCFDKCYICEEKEPTGLQVEHRIAHRGDKALILCWDNLLLSCYHCNRTKGDNFNRIINCTQLDPEEYIAISMMPFPKEYVEIAILRDTIEAKETAALLNLIYNGEKTDILCAECINLRKRILQELNNMQEKLDDYDREKNQKNKNEYLQSIIRMIDRSAAFAAIKRAVIRNTPAYMHEFGKYLA